jgi:hypothetical protein
VCRPNLKTSGQGRAFCASLPRARSWRETRDARLDHLLRFHAKCDDLRLKPPASSGVAPHTTYARLRSSVALDARRPRRQPAFVSADGQLRPPVVSRTQYIPTQAMDALGGQMMETSVRKFFRRYESFFNWSLHSPGPLIHRHTVSDGNAPSSKGAISRCRG